jgi:hypothetical protein
VDGIRSILEQDGKMPRITAPHASLNIKGFRK